jgi:hypothetical protein
MRKGTPKLPLWINQNYHIGNLSIKQKETPRRTAALLKAINLCGLER